MPLLLSLRSPDWQLDIWSKDITRASQQLANTLTARDKLMPIQGIRLHGISKIAVNDIPQKSANEVNLAEPIFFENRSYDFEFTFNGTVEDAEILHRLNSVCDNFHCTGDGRPNTRASLRGVINFGNDVGWFRLGLAWMQGGQRHENALSFQVWPTKMDMVTDLNAIQNQIDKQYPLWRFSFVQKTDHELARSRQPFERFPLLWLAQFASLRAELHRHVRYICNSPHNRLQPIVRSQRLEQLRGKLPPKLEEQVGLAVEQKINQNRFKVTQRRLSLDTPENRFIKMVLERCQRELGQFISRAKNINASTKDERLSEAFFSELARWKKPLQQALAQPMFAEVGDYTGSERESLVLHQRAGYSGVYRVWQQLKMYLTVFGQSANISLKSVAELYEVWCLLEVRQQLLDLGFAEDSAQQAKLSRAGFDWQLNDGQGAAFCFSRDDGLTLRLAHEPLITQLDKSSFGQIYSWNNNQKPDILLEVTFPNDEKITWIFDAKYRIETNKEGVDLAPEDAINQMHRYRDALIHVQPNTNNKLKSRPVIGAFVLYPSWFGDQDEASANPYADAIEAVGIGAFPALPCQENKWLRQFLAQHLARVPTAIISDSSVAEPILYSMQTPDAHLAQESVRIAPTGMQISRYSDLVLVAKIGSDRDMGYCRDVELGRARYYHTPVDTTEREHLSHTAMLELTHCALAGAAGVQFVYPIKSIKIVPRKAISAEQSGRISDEIKKPEQDYWLIELGVAEALSSCIAIPQSEHLQMKLSSTVALHAGCAWETLPVRYGNLYSPKITSGH
ncbi:restriction endonuclease-like protein [uncultured Deefgea sp.]|uniref:restriction endonuclease-like protein n=1 Tax=uncultured Deefgea sp. TaxID=1304914 RepID=UPI002618AC56|nr:restriction endonuclease-like protein [uncultured Deefgea sp.]